jgi:hypothetical protein
VRAQGGGSKKRLVITRANNINEKIGSYEGKKYDKDQQICVCSSTIGLKY